MTSAQIAKIKTLLGYDASTNRMGADPLTHNLYIVVTKETQLYSDIDNWRYSFDDTNKLLKRYQVRPYSYDAAIVPEHGNYDSYATADHDVVIYEYLTDSNGHILTDYFDYDMIVMFVPRAVYVLSEDIVGGN